MSQDFLQGPEPPVGLGRRFRLQHHVAPMQRRRQPVGPGWGGVLAITLIFSLLGGGAGAWAMARFGGALGAVRATQSGAAQSQATPPGASPLGAASNRDGDSDTAAVVPTVRTQVEFTSVISDAAAKVGPSVVGIVNQVRSTAGFRTLGSGSGIVLDRRGHIVTNAHVVDLDAALRQGQRLLVSTADGRTLPAELVGSDDLTDLAVIRVEVTDLPAVEMGDSDRVRVGDIAIAIGNPLGMDFQRTVTAGIISGKERELTIQTERGIETTLQVLQTDAAINPGNSGGALVNAAGQLIGINSAKVSHSGVEGIGFAIPVNWARPILEQLMTNGQVQRPVLGISASPSKQAELEQGIDVGDGILVWNVVPGGPAQRAGIQRGDVITSIEGSPVRRYGEMVVVLGRFQADQEVAVQGKRYSGGRWVEFQAKVVLARPG